MVALVCIADGAFVVQNYFWVLENSKQYYAKIHYKADRYAEKSPQTSLSRISTSSSPAHASNELSQPPSVLWFIVAELELSAGFAQRHKVFQPRLTPLPSHRGHPMGFTPGQYGIGTLGISVPGIALHLAMLKSLLAQTRSHTSAQLIRRSYFTGCLLHKQHIQLLCR